MPEGPLAYDVLSSHSYDMRILAVMEHILEHSDDPSKRIDELGHRIDEAIESIRTFPNKNQVYHTMMDGRPVRGMIIDKGQYVLKYSVNDDERTVTIVSISSTKQEDMLHPYRMM